MKTYRGESTEFDYDETTHKATVGNGTWCFEGIPISDIIGFLNELGYAVITKEDATSASNALAEEVRNLRTLGLNLTADEKHETWRRVTLASLPQAKWKED